MRTSHNESFSLFVSYSSGGSGVSLRWNSVIGRYTFEREICLTVQNAINPLLIYECVIYLWFSIIWVDVGTLFSLPFLEFNIKAYKSFFERKFSKIILISVRRVALAELVVSIFIMWAFVSPLMIWTLCLGIVRTREDSSVYKVLRSVSALAFVGQ